LHQSEADRATLEYAINHLKTNVLVSMQHTECGALNACLGALTSEGKPSRDKFIQGYMRHLEPPVKRAIKEADRKGLSGKKRNKFLQRAMPEHNADHQIRQMLKSRQIKQFLKGGGIVVGLVQRLPEHGIEVVSAGVNRGGKNVVITDVEELRQIFKGATKHVKRVTAS